MPGALWTWKARRRGVISSDGWVDATIIEVGDRWFLTDTFVDNPGEELDRSREPVLIGRAVRRWLRNRPRRPGLSRPKPDELAWEAFCENVVGVDPREPIQPERSLFVSSRGRVFQCRDELGGDDAWLRVADEDEAVGTLVVEQLARLPVRAPIVARASVTELDGRWQVMATPRLRWTKHVHTAEAAGLLAAVTAALDQSAILSAGEAESADAFEAKTPEGRALRDAAWVQVARRRDGSLVVFGGGGILDVAADELEVLVRTELVAEATTAAVPVPPRSEVGISPMTTWLAVSGVPLDDLVSTLGLVDTLPIDAADGLAWARGEGVVVLPPIEGWTLAAGRDLALDEDFDVVGLSRRLATIVQAFRTQAELGRHEWAWAETGVVRRSARFVAGRDPEWLTTGEPTPGEADVGLPEPPTEEDVLTVAGAWSVDPTRLPPLNDLDARWGRLP